MGTWRDTVVTEKMGDGVTYFDLKEEEKALIRKEAVERYISEEPEWLQKYSTWVAGLPNVGDDVEFATPFACDIIASRMTRQWQNQVAKANLKTKPPNKRSSGKEENENGQAEDEDHDKQRKRQRTQESESDAMACDVCHSELKRCCIAFALAQMSVLFQSMG